MKTQKKIVVIVMLLFFFVPAYAQFDTETYDSTENLILYQRQRTFGVVLHNLGLGVQFRSGKRTSYFKTRMWEIEFVSMKSYKQVKVLNPYFTNSRRYVYGKLNEAFFLRGGMVWKKLLNRKPYWGGVELRWLYGGGVSVGFAKPYYLYVLYFYDTGNGFYSYDIKTERFDPSSQSWDDIYGRAPFTVGFSEMTFHPGIYLKTALNFEFGVRSTKIKALEVGATLDISPMGLSIMADNKNQIFFPTIFLNFSFGKRFNKY